MVSRRWKGRKKKRSGAGGAIMAIFLLGVLSAAGVAWLVLTPCGPETETFVEIAPGSSTLAIGQKLEAAGVVRSQFAFDLLRWVKRGRLLAGEYRFDHPAPATEVYARLRRGDV